MSWEIAGGGEVQEWIAYPLTLMTSFSLSTIQILPKLSSFPTSWSEGQGFSSVATGKRRE